MSQSNQINTLNRNLLINTFSSRNDSCKRFEQEDCMLYYALVFLIIGLIAGALGIYGVAAIAGQIAYVLFLIGVVFLVIHLVSDRRTLV